MDKYHIMISNDRLLERGDKLNESVRIKIADLGNACWTHYHFATEI